MEAAKRANRILGMIKMTIVSREQVYLGCINRWSGHMWSIMEGKQNDKRTRKLYTLRKIDKMWINKFGKQKNLMKAYKIMTGKEAISVHKLFKISMENRTRGHEYKLYKNKLRPGRVDFS